MDEKELHSSKWISGVRPTISDPASLEFAIDESPEFHDPYSDLNLYLSRKIKEEFRSCQGSKKWSLQVQESLLEKIGGEFHDKFPRYRLGVSALKKIWEKCLYYSHIFESQKEALTDEGTLNTHFLIRENLKQFLGTKKRFSFHPYLLAQQLALKIAECLVAYDGIRPILQHMTKIIWATEQHLIPPAQIPSHGNPYDEFDKWDKIIVKTMLEVSGKKPFLSQEELQKAVRESIRNLKELPQISYDTLAASISALLAQKLYSRAAFHLYIAANQKRALNFFLQNHLVLYRSWSGTYTELVLRLKALYSLACQKDRDLPLLSPHDLEIIIWKTVAEDQKLLEILPQAIFERIEDEIGYIFIDNPHQNFRTAVDTTVQFFKTVKELSLSTNWVEIEHKITLWTLQGDLVYRLLKIEDSTLLRHLYENREISIAESYLREYPFLAHFADLLEIRIKILKRYIWYVFDSKPIESTVHRFLKWHLERGATLTQIEEICKKQLPLLPFDRSIIALFFSKEQKTADPNEGEAE